MQPEIYGVHLAMRASNFRNKSVLDDSTVVSDFLGALVDRIGMRILAGPLVGRDGGSAEKYGCSGVVLLHESHAALHTYPGIGEIFLDVFSCRSFDEKVVIETVEIFFGSHRVVEQTLLNRGIHWGTDVSMEMASWLHTR